MPALKAYLSGEQAFRASVWKRAKEDFTRAVEADSTFALALYRLSLTEGWLDPTSPEIREYSKRALRFADRLPEREVLLLRSQVTCGRASLETLDSLTTRYPDDADGWYELGETHYHGGPPLLQPDEKFRQAFRKAIELDPSFGSAYIHLISDAFSRADSAEARRLIAAYARIEPVSPETLASNLSLALAWGDADAKRAATAVLDTASATLLSRTMIDIIDARELWQESLLVSRALSAQPVAAVDWGRNATVRILGARGRIKEARAALLAEPMGDSEHWIRDLLVLWSQIDYVDASSADPAARALATEPSALDRLLLGAHALALGNRTDVRQQLESLDSLAAAGPQYLATGDPVDARAVAEALRAVASERDGNRSDAIRRLEAALPGIPGECPGEGCPVHGVLRFQLGRWLLDEGQPARAEPYFASLTRRRSYGFLPVSLYLGKAYEALGNLDDARREYEMFAQDWQDCDPELRPLLDDAKQSLARMKEVRKL